MSRRLLSNTARQIASSSNSAGRLPGACQHFPTTGPSSRCIAATPSTRRILHPASTTQSRCYAAPTLKFKQSNISVEEYQRLSDQVFDSLTDYLEDLAQEYEGEDADDFEVEYSSGVLNLRLADHGTYVINKQPANKQIWFSSPTSGPKRFDFDNDQQAWFMFKDGEETNLRDLLDRELSKIFGKEVKVNLGER